MAESKLELLGRRRRVEVMNARVGHAGLLEASGSSETTPLAASGGRGWPPLLLRGGGGGCNASCMHSAASAFVNAKASTDFRCTFSALVCFILDVKACVFVQC